MENSNASANPQGGDLSNFNKAFEDYQKNQVKGAKRKSKEDILAKYFTPRKDKETFRILPYKTKNFYVETFFHVVPTNIAGGTSTTLKKKQSTVVYCPAHNDPRIPVLDENGVQMKDGNCKLMTRPAPCPLCDKAKRKLAEQDQSIKFIKKENLDDDQKKIAEKNKAIFIEASKWEAKKFYIVRGIDKGAEKDGVKFWRFKHNYNNQGTLDKLYPILNDFHSQHGVNFADAEFGADLNILMGTTSMKRGDAVITYKTISAITIRGKSLLHNDPLCAKAWLEDPIGWRDIFKAKTAPGITPLEYLEMIAKGTNPYWEDTDASKKHWVFPGRPDLELKANTRTRNLDKDEEEDFEQASDLDYTEQPVTINNVTASNVGTYKETASDITAKATPPANPAPREVTPAQQVTNAVNEATSVEDEHEDIMSDAEEVGDVEDYTDLPF